ncbi:MAG: hypothetical protein RIG77_11785 [Cyclobacteriaceae bacterium]
MKNQALFILLVLILGFFVIPVQAQNAQQDFLNGKQFLNEGKYNLAMESFQKLTSPESEHSFKEYASFYYALAAYKNGDLGLARSMWLQVESRYPKWNKINEVYGWLAETYYREGNPKKGTHYAKKSALPEESGLISNYLSQLDDLEVLQQIYQEYPEDRVVATALAEAILQQPLSDRDFQLIRELIDKFNFDNSYFGLADIGKSTQKKTYRVAVLLPFMYENLDDTRRVERNKFVLDIYRGILQAADDLNAEGELIKIYPYDTKRDKDVTAGILATSELKGMDLIIGPLYPEPSKLTSDFCFANKINMINPVSSNSVIINNNPFSFLFEPTHETQALRAADFVIDSFQHKKENAFIFFNDNEKDSLMAKLYSEKIAEDGFEVVHNIKIDEEKIKTAYELLTETYEFKLTREEADSIRKIKGRIVKENKPKSDKDSLYLYEERFTIERDSIGHIYLASSESLHASMFISAVEIRGDNIPIIGRHDWLNYDMLTIDQMERLGVYFIHPDLLRQGNPEFIGFRNKYQKKYKETPTMSSMLAYELMMYTGEMMEKYGNYFQNGTLQEGFTPGRLFYGIEYNLSNSNQVVPITKFKDSELQLVNIKDDQQKQ